MKYPPVDYTGYLGLDKLLGAQKPKSDEYKKPAHDEMLFIITHQAYELWFKQIIHELDSVLSLFSNNFVEERNMGVIVSRLDRIMEVFKLIQMQIPVLETMTPLDFLDFRDMLYPASGFQSFQFRVIENKLGLNSNTRLTYNDAPYSAIFDENEKKKLSETEKLDSLFVCVDNWLKRTPFLKDDGFDFWNDYKKSVKKMLDNERDLTERNSLITDEIKQKQLNQILKTEELFEALFNKDKYDELVKLGKWRLSYESVHAALLIQMYRFEPVFQLPFRLITRLIDIDETLTEWRYKHALMAKRMLGTKVGTGGSSGAEYLKKSTEQHKIFSDFFQLTTFFIPRSELPTLPKSLTEKMQFKY